MFLGGLQAALHGTKPYKFIRLGDFHGPKPYKFIGFGATQYLEKFFSNPDEGRTHGVMATVPTPYCMEGPRQVGPYATRVFRFRRGLGVERPPSSRKPTD